jgi:hypothetical protein
VYGSIEGASHAGRAFDVAWIGARQPRQRQPAERETELDVMGVYVTGTIAVLLAVVGFVLLLFIPGFALVAAIALGIGIVLAIVVGIGAANGRTSDTEERRAEFEQEHRRAR